MRRAITACTLPLTAALLGCATKEGAGGADGSWSVTASAERELWLWLDEDIPDDEEFFTLDATPAAFPDGDFDAALEILIRVTLEADGGDTAAVPGGDLSFSLLRDDAVVASDAVPGASAGDDIQVTLTDAEGLSGCDGSGPCTLLYTITGSLDGQDTLATGDASLSAWIEGAGTPPEDAALTFSFF